MVPLRASGCQWGAPRPVKAGTIITPPGQGHAFSAPEPRRCLDRDSARPQPLHHSPTDKHALPSMANSVLRGSLRGTGGEQAVVKILRK
jgi:hypothetical protein